MPLRTVPTSDVPAGDAAGAGEEAAYIYVAFPGPNRHYVRVTPARPPRLVLTLDSINRFRFTFPKKSGCHDSFHAPGVTGFA